MNKKGLDKVARKLAAALFERLRISAGVNLTQADICLQNLAGNIRANSELRSCLLNPSVSQSDKVAILSEICTQDSAFKDFNQEVQSVFNTFFEMVLEYGATMLVHKISAHFTKLLEALHKLASIEVSSAFEYSAADRSVLEQRLATDLGLTPKIMWSIDKNLIGGAVVKLHDQILDSSVRGALNNLKEALL